MKPALLSKRKGRQTGKGSRKGSSNSVVSSKDKWITKIRVQREFLKELRTKKLLTSEQYQSLYSKSKGGFFRNKRHIKLYLTELLGNHMPHNGSLENERKGGEPSLK